MTVLLESNTSYLAHFLVAVAGLIVLRAAEVHYNRRAIKLLKESRVNENFRKVLLQCPTLKHYKEPIVLPTGLLQTRFNIWMLPRNIPLYERQVLHLPERKKPSKATCCPAVIPEGLVSVDWIDPERDNQKYNSNALVLIIPGVTGSSNEPYIKVFCEALAKAGFRTGCYNPRSRGGNELITPFLYAAGFTEDVKYVISRVKQDNPSKKLFVLGFSLGAGILAKYLGEEGDEAIVDGAIVYAGPVDLPKNLIYLEQTISSRICQSELMGYLQKITLDFEPILKKAAHIDLTLAKKAKKLLDYDRHFTAKMFEFDSTDEYYSVSSSKNFLPNIKADTLFINARNDPIIDVVEELMEVFDNNPNLFRVVTNAGGHSMTWPTGILGTYSWSVQVAIEFINAKLDLN